MAGFGYGGGGLAAPLGGGAFEDMAPPPPPHPVKPQRSKCWERLTQGLGSCEDVPDYQRRDFILKGYRLQTRGCACCYRSIWAVHNEAANIWTHLMGFILVLLRLVALLRSGELRPFGDGGSYEDVLAVALYLATLLCLFCSSNYHARACDELDVFNRCFLCDVGSIVALVGVSTVVGVAIGFRCHPLARIVYIAASISSMGIMAFATNSAAISDTVREIIYTLCAGVGLVPAVHYCVAAPWAEVTTLVPYIAGMFASYGVGVAIKQSLYPEKRWPGKFDYLGQSHNIWHLFVLLGMSVWLVGIESIVRLHRVTTC